MHKHFIKETVHTSVSLVEGTRFTSLVLHPVRRSGMRWAGTAVVWICAVGGRHWPATPIWTTSTISPVKRSSWVSTVVSDVWTALQNVADNMHLTTQLSTVSPRIISIHLLEDMKLYPQLQNRPRIPAYMHRTNCDVIETPSSPVSAVPSLLPCQHKGNLIHYKSSRCH